MHKRVHTWLRVSTALLVFSGYLALVSVRGYSPALLLIPAVLLTLAPLGEYLDRSSTAYRIATKTITILVGVCVPYMWYLLGMMNGVILLTVYIQVYTLMHRKQERNYYHLYLMALFLLLAACVQAPEPSIGLVMALFLLSGVWAFLSLRIHEELRQRGEDRPAEIVPLHGTAIHAESTAVFDLGLILAVTALSFAAIGLTVIIFVFTPGVEAGILGRNSAPIPLTGIPQTVDIGKSGTIQQDYSPVMNVRFPDEPGGQLTGTKDLYWRVTTLPRYTLSRWERRGLFGHAESRAPDYAPHGVQIAQEMDPYSVTRDHRKTARLVNQAIYMDAVPPQGIPALDRVVSLRVDGHPKNVKVSWDSNQDFTVNFTTPGARRLSYDAESEVDQPTPAQLRGAPSNYAGYLDARDLELLTHQDLLPETIAQAQRLAAGKTNPYDKAIAIRDWLSGKDFLYTLAIPVLPPENPIDAFVNTVRRGHCELFGSAMALMLRSLGVPCRAVSGYRGGEWNGTDASYTIRGNMAHFWVEVYFPTYGWVIIDPSPRADPADNSMFGQITRFISWTQLRSKMFWYQQVVGFDRTVALNLLRNASLRLVAWFQRDAQTQNAPAATAPTTPYNGIPWGSITLGIALLAIVGTLVRMRRVAASRPVLTDDQTRALRLFRGMQRQLAGAGIDVRDKTADELQVVAATHSDIDSANLELLIKTYNDARFGQRPFPRTRFAELRAKLRALRVRES